MDQLEICAEIRYSRPLPYYLEIDCRQTVMGFVHGGCSPEVEFRGLEQFRRAIIKLVEEGLARPEGCGEVMEPHVRVVLKGGRDFMRPTHEFDVVIAREDAAGIENWVLWWKEEDGSSRQGAFLNPTRALGVMKALLDETTARWASAVVFEAKASDSLEAKPPSDE